MTVLNLSEWDSFLSSYPNAHMLQTGPWGELKAAFGWEVARITKCQEGKRLPPPEPDTPQASVAAQILFRRLPLGLGFAYIPKGPVTRIIEGESAVDRDTVWEALLPELDEHCRKRGVVFLKVEPDLWQAGVTPGTAIGALPPPRGFQPSKQAIQPLRTLVVDLRGDEDQILARMKQKTRYNIKLALKKGVVVHPSADVDTFYRLMLATAGREQFGVHSLDYYRRVYELFYPRGACELLIAEYQNNPLAALMVFAHGQRAWYFYGASTSDHRDRMPTYLLQWEAMRWARSRGCIEYDLWGVPDEDEDELEKQFTRRTDGLWGVYRFKRGFGGQLRRSAGPWDRVYRPALYTLYNLWLSRQSG